MVSHMDYHAAPGPPLVRPLSFDIPSAWSALVLPSTAWCLGQISLVLGVFVWVPACLVLGPWWENKGGPEGERGQLIGHTMLGYSALFRDCLSDLDSTTAAVDWWPWSGRD